MKKLNTIVLAASLAATSSICTPTIAGGNGKEVKMLKGRSVQLYSEPGVKSRHLEVPDIKLINARMPVPVRAKKVPYYEVQIGDGEYVWIKKNSLIVMRKGKKVVVCNKRSAAEKGDQYAATAGSGLSCP